MENLIIIFLALLWACFAANADVPNSRHRNLAPGNMKDVCVNLHDWGQGNCSKSKCFQVRNDFLFGNRWLNNSVSLDIRCAQT